MITPKQILLARTMLEMSQKGAAKKLGISHTALSKIEKGKSDAPISRYIEIQQFYEAMGVEFLDQDGVKRKAAKLREYKGHEAFKEFMYDVYQTVKNGGDVCVTNVDEREFANRSTAYRADYITKMSQIKGLSFRILIEENDDYVLASSYATYRTMPAKDFGNVPTYIYGDKKAEILFTKESVLVIAIENKDLADAQRKLFNIAWSQASE